MESPDFPARAEGSEARAVQNEVFDVVSFPRKRESRAPARAAKSGCPLSRHDTDVSEQCPHFERLGRAVVEGEQGVRHGRKPASIAARLRRPVRSC